MAYRYIVWLGQRHLVIQLLLTTIFTSSHLIHHETPEFHKNGMVPTEFVTNFLLSITCSYL